MKTVSMEDGAFATFFVPSAGDFTAQESPPLGMCHLRQEIANARGQPGETGRSWN